VNVVTAIRWFSRGIIPGCFLHPYSRTGNRCAYCRTVLIVFNIVNLPYVSLVESESEQPVEYLLKEDP